MIFPNKRLIKPRPGARINKGHRLAKGLVGCWLFNDYPKSLGTTYDLSGNGYHGTLVGDTHSVPGKFGPALSFDGSGWVNIPNNEDLQLKTYNFSIAAWTYVTATGQQVFLFHGLGGVAWSSYTLGIGGGDVVVEANKYVFSFGTGAAASHAKISSVNDAYTDQWVHLAVTYAGTAIDGVLKLYIDGALDTTATSGVYGKPGTSATSLYMGADPYTGGRYPVVGQIDNVSIYKDITLSAPEVASLDADPFQMFNRDNIVLWQPSGGEPPVGGAGIMTTNTGFWGATY